MKIIETGLQDCLLIEPRCFHDQRGYFCETYQKKRYSEILNDLDFVQDNLSCSKKNVLRGLHFQREHPQGKLVRVAYGAVWDVAVDIRQDSPTFGRWVGYELSAENQRQLWIPPGFAHGFVALSEMAVFEYKCTDYYFPDDEGAIRFDDPSLSIEWPIKDPIVSEKDLSAPLWAEVFGA